MAQKTTVLMYHALSDALGGASHGPEDAHYSVSIDHFQRQLALLSEHGLSAASVSRVSTDASLGIVGITFDDGHASNLAAARLLHEKDWSADFFVNPSTIGAPHFLTWGDLQEMADMGMSIQSHGQSHRFLDELSDAEVRAELQESKKQIEQQIGRPVTVFAPPGGRISEFLPHHAKELGYTHICTSRVGLWDMSPQSMLDIPRFAMLQQTSDQQFLAWITQDKAEIEKQVARYNRLRVAKRILGNKLYVALRQKILKSPVES
jgi:peptidoglycan/xylan/chitin deacetylase (PgdA/CDA1 family)